MKPTPPIPSWWTTISEGRDEIQMACDVDSTIRGDITRTDTVQLLDVIALHWALNNWGPSLQLPTALEFALQEYYEDQHSRRTRV